MLLGIGSYAFAWSIGVPGYEPAEPMSAENFLTACKVLGADVVQIADNLPLHKLSDGLLIQLKELADQLQLSVEIGMRGLLPDSVSRYLVISRFFQSPFLRLVIDSPGDAPDLEEVITRINKLLPDFRRHNILLAIENHDRFTAEQFRQIVMATDPDQVGICLDPVNSLGKGQGFFEVADVLLPLTINVHIKDYQIRRMPHQMGFQVSGTPAGQGMLPIPWLLEELSKNGRCYSAILELWPPAEEFIDDTIQKERLWATESMRYLQGLDLDKL